jgi:hypothetical protein
MRPLPPPRRAFTSELYHGRHARSADFSAARGGGKDGRAGNGAARFLKHGISGTEFRNENRGACRI